MTTASDVSVVLLTVGEETTSQAVDSVKRQTFAPAEIVEVRDVRPFHAAMNQGVARATAPLVLQLDADMVLDPRCIEVLRGALHADPAVGVAVGFLRDALVGRVSGIKLFRRASLEARAFGESISPDTDLLEELRHDGWRDVYVLDSSRADPSIWHTLGEHAPPYDDARFTYAKCALEGARYRYRGDVGGLRWHLGVLHRSRHRMAPVARVGFLNGVVMATHVGTMDRADWLDGFDELTAFMSTTNEYPVRTSALRMALSLSPKALFLRCHELGATLRRANAYPTFTRLSGSLATSYDRLNWVALAGLCRGVLMPDAAQAEEYAARDADSLNPLIPTFLPRLEGKLRDLGGWIRNRY